MLYRALSVLPLLALLTACDRPFSEPARPSVVVLGPDLSVVQSERQMQLAVRISADVDIAQVLAEDDTLVYDAAQNRWQGGHVLTNGLNRIVLSIVDVDMRRTRDTIYALADVLTSARSQPYLPEPRGGHTTTRSADGTFIVVGGAPSVGADALDTGLRLSDGGNEFVPLVHRLNVPRTGHTATALPDGRILIVGGSAREGPTSLDDIVETVEVFRPSDGAFAEVDVVGPPVRRAYHTATLHLDGAEVYVDLYGGVGDISYQNPTLGTRSDVRRFRVDGDSMFALDPAPGPRLDFLVSGHSQIELFPNVIGPKWYIVTGTFYEDAGAQDVSFELEYEPEIGLLQYAVGLLQEPRTGHAATLLEEGFVGIFGGRKSSPEETLNLTEIYAAPVRRYFRYPETGSMLSRYGHTATKVENRRILLLGGFLSSGQGAVTSELYQIPQFQQGLTPGADR